MLLGIPAMLLQVLQPLKPLFLTILKALIPPSNHPGMSLQVHFWVFEVLRPAAKPHGYWLCGGPSLDYYRRAHFAPGMRFRERRASAPASVPEGLQSTSNNMKRNIPKAFSGFWGD